MLQIAFPGVEIVLILPGIEASVIFLDNFGLLIKELALLILHFVLPLIHKLATANIASPHSLDFERSSLLVVIFPLDLEHSPAFLNYYSSRILLVSEFLSLI